MIQKGGARIEDGFSALVGRVGTLAAVERADAPRPADDYGRDRTNDAPDRFDNSSREAAGSDDRSATQRADRDDNYGRDHGGDHRDERSDAGGVEHGEGHADDHSSEQDTEQADAPEDQDQDGESQASSDDGGEDETANSSDSDGETQTADSDTDGQDGPAQSGGATGTAKADIGEAMAGALFNLMPGSKGIGVDGQASEQGKVSSAVGIATAIQNIASATAEENTSKATPAAAGAAGGGRNDHQAQANASAQAKAVANENAAMFKESQTNTPLGTVETQASGIAKALGDGNRAQAQSVSSASSAGSPHAGGGEGVTQAGGVTGTQQTQGQNAAEKANNIQKSASSGRSMADQISVKISKAIQAGSDKITIQLRPANMGRVEVKLEMLQDNRISVLVIADNRDTLELLLKDTRGLQRALQEAGLHAESGDLNFSQRGEENQAQKDNGPSSRPLSGNENMAELEEMIVEEAVIASDGRVLANGRIDVRA